MAYVYRHVRLDTNEVFYIGVGSDIKYNRSRSKIRSVFWHNIVNKTEYRIDILLDNISEEEAYIKEIEFIKLYGRRDLELGTLVNLTNGGNGSITYKHTKEIKEFLSNFNKGHKRNKGKAKTLEQRLHQSNIMKGRSNGKTGTFHSKETKLKMSNSSPRRKQSSEIKEIIANSHKKLILDLVMGIYYNGAREAALAFNINESTLRSRLNGSLKNNTNLIYT